MTQKEWIQPSPLLLHVWYCTAAHPWWFSGYRTAVVAPATDLGHTTGTFLQGQGNLSWCQGGFSSGTAHQNTALTTGTTLGWQGPLSLRGQQGFREVTCPLSLPPLPRTRVILASVSQTGECPVPQTQAYVSHLWGGGSWDYSIRSWPDFPVAPWGTCANKLAAFVAVGGQESPAWII